MLLNEIIDEINKKIKKLESNYQLEIDSVIKENLKIKLEAEKKYQDNKLKIESLTTMDLSKLNKLENKHYVMNNDKNINGYYIDICYYDKDILRFIDRKGKVSTVSKFYYNEKGQISFIKSFNLENYYDNNVIYLTLDRCKKTIYNVEGKEVYTENYYTNNKISNIVNYSENDKKIIKVYNRKGELDSISLYNSNGNKELVESYLNKILKSKTFYDETGKIIGLVNYREDGTQLNKSLYCNKKNIIIQQALLLNGNTDNIIVYNISGSKRMYLNYKMNMIKEKVIYDENENKIYQNLLNLEGLMLSENIFNNKLIKDLDKNSLVSHPIYLKALEIEKELFKNKTSEVNILENQKKDSIAEKIKIFVNKLNLKINSKNKI